MGDAATDEIMQGWKEGYEFLADLLIGMEDNLKKVHANTKGQLLLFPEMRRVPFFKDSFFVKPYLAIFCYHPEPFMNN